MDAMAELQKRVGCFIASRSDMSRNEFEDWFLDALWDVERSSDSIAQARFHKIEGLLAEASHAHWDDSAVRRELANAIRPFGNVIEIPVGPPRYTLGPTSVPIRLRVAG